MLLTSEQLLELIELMQASRDLRPSDRRKQARIGMRYRLNIRRLLEAEQTVRRAVFLRNLSIGGVGLSANFRLNEGEEFVIELPRAGGQIHQIVCRVTHLKSISGGIFQFGGRFVAPFEQVKRPAKAKSKT